MPLSVTEQHRSSERTLIRTAAGVSWRFEHFGAVAYVGDRDDFFAIDQPHAKLLVIAQQSAGGWVSGTDADRAATLAALGIVQTTPATPQRAHLGRSLVGDFVGLPELSAPLVLNCFSTAHCPLRCVYCHADDLMVPFRDGEGWADMRRVLSTAARVPAMVAVVTGGDPIVAPQRAAWLLGRLAGDKRLVLDTSGAGDVGPLLPALRRHRVHVRVSLDSSDRAVNDRARPINPRYLPRGTSSSSAAHETLRRLAQAQVAHSVQTVVGRHNDDLDALRRMRDHLLSIGVRHWVLHVAVPAGKAERRPEVLPGWDVVDRLRTLVAECATAGPLDIRVTGTHREPNAVLLVDPRGQLCVQRPHGPGKEVLWADGDTDQAGLLERLRQRVDWAGHASRYLNGTLEPAPQRMPALSR